MDDVDLFDPPPWLVAWWADEEAARDAEWIELDLLAPPPVEPPARPPAGSAAEPHAELPPEPRAEVSVEFPAGTLSRPPDASLDRPLELALQELLPEPASASDAGRIDRLVMLEAMKARIDAAQLRLLATLDAADRSQEHFLTEDVRFALRLSAVAAATRISQARMLTQSLPATLAALSAGVIPAGHAGAVCEAAERIEPIDRARLEQLVLPRAGSQTRAELTRSLRRAVLRADPGGGNRRHRAAFALRRVCRYADDDAMASLVLHGAAGDVATLYDRLDAAAHRVPDGDSRTMDERRADVFVDALLAGLPLAGLPARHGRAPAADVRVALSTLLGHDDEPGELAGYGPVPADVARDLATQPDSTWRRLLTDPVTGGLLDYGRTTYRPPAGLRDFVVARDRTCVAPGCAIPARRCDLDHIRSFHDGGPTSAANLAPLCGRHHDAKTKNYLTYRRDPDGGYTWITPTGHTYRTPPPDD